ncbi:13349_t:CDS:2 [Cetraspora pellucida]|uniref:13349_t:CDS:1 n=1 Tax=Cetraspora pellucida TaxID=1433469 RepID=A0ACA9QE49_9GLOM|nr:13349_t:CDS:2 [Cetraspora pellucida]
MSEIQGYKYDFDEFYVDYELSKDGINLDPSELIAVDDDLSVIEEGKDLVSENGSLDNEPEDSPLKEIYVEQTFVLFDILEQCLKCYSTRMGFETKIVRAEKKNDIFIHKTYKCRHSGKENSNTNKKNHKEKIRKRAIKRRKSCMKKKSRKEKRAMPKESCKEKVPHQKNREENYKRKATPREKAAKKKSHAKEKGHKEKESCQVKESHK